MKRKIIMHVGPTNSGKTHNALKALANAKSGVYCGPLRSAPFNYPASFGSPDSRLLAAEVWEKLNTQYNVPCNLITGQQQLINEEARHVACTIGPPSHSDSLELS